MQRPYVKLIDRHRPVVSKLWSEYAPPGTKPPLRSQGVQRANLPDSESFIDENMVMNIDSDTSSEDEELDIVDPAETPAATRPHQATAALGARSTR